MYDCVFPTRTARFGTALTFEGPLHIKNAKFTTDHGNKKDINPLSFVFKDLNLFSKLFHYLNEFKYHFVLILSY